MPQAVGTAVLGEVGLGAIAALEFAGGLTGATIAGYAVLASATGGLTFTPIPTKETSRDSAERDPEA